MKKIIKNPRFHLAIIFVLALVILIYQITTQIIPSVSLVLLCVGSGYGFKKLTDKNIQTYRDFYYKVFKAS